MTIKPDNEHDMLSAPEVCTRVNLSNSQIYRLIKMGRFPKSIRLSHKKAVWMKKDIEKWLNDRFNN